MIKRRYGLWIGLVLLNAIIGLLFSIKEDNHRLDNLGIACGVLTFMAVYIEADYAFARRGWHTLRQRLVISALLRALLQLTLYVDLYAGMFALLLVDHAVGEVRFLSMYLAVLAHGAILSVLVAAILGAIQLAARAFERRKARRTPDALSSDPSDDAAQRR